MGEASTDHTDLPSIFFYTVLAMNAIFGGYWAINSMCELQVSQSEHAVRLAVSPLHEGKVLLAGFIVSIVIQIVFLLIQFAYMYFILDVPFGSQLGYVFPMMVLRVFAGDAFGILASGITSKIPPDGETGTMTSITPTCSALAGTMVVRLKYYVQEYVPSLTHVNLVNTITGGLYSLCYYGIGERYFFNLALPIGLTMACYLISFRVFSRESYHSLEMR